MRDVIGKNPDREIQYKGYRALADVRHGHVELAKKIEEDKEVLPRLERILGKAEVAKYFALFAHAQQEEDELRKTIREKYSDFVTEVLDISVGKPAPEVISEGLNGETVKLSDHKGKVVVLDVWATWCPPCKEMIPHERQMVERLKGKPFELVSISVDAKKETLKEFLSKEKMPWTHWWVGGDSKFGEAWRIQSYPTIIVIDADGVIRHKDLRGEDLEKAVHVLLKEAERRIKRTAAR